LVVRKTSCRHSSLYSTEKGALPLLRTKPTDSGLDNQYTAEVFYRLQVAQNLAITLDIHLIIDSALNPDEDQIWLGSLRLRFSF